MDITWAELETLVDKFINQVYESKWTPSYIIGVTRGGSIPATLISHKMSIPMYSLDISLHQPVDTVLGNTTTIYYPDETINGYKFLIVDDINNTGETLSWIKRDWRQSLLHKTKPKTRNWPWCHIKFGVLMNNVNSQFKCDYSAMDTELAKDQILFPWHNKNSLTA